MAESAHKRLSLEPWLLPPSLIKKSIINNQQKMRYSWVTLVILVLWISVTTLLVSDRIAAAENFFLLAMIATVVISFIGFRSA